MWQSYMENATLFSAEFTSTVKPAYFGSETEFLICTLKKASTKNYSKPRKVIKIFAKKSILASGIFF